MRPRALLAFGNFFSVAHFYLIIYILAPYLATFLPADETGLVVSAGALATLAIFPSAPRLVALVGARRLAFLFCSAEALALVTLALEPIPVIALIATALACAISPLIAYGLDLLLEATVASAEEGVTGRVRTAFLTAGNSALILAPLIAGLLLGATNEYYRVFLAAAASLIPFLILFGVWEMPEGTIPIQSDVRRAWVIVRRNKDLRSVMAASFILQFFYKLEPLYIPLYLHNVLGIPWETLGWVFGVTLLPFVLLEYPAGTAADRFLGDKALLGTGFIVLGAGLALIGLLIPASPLVIVLSLMLALGVGGSFVESMTEGHFFRRVSETDTDIVSVFRSTRPLGSLLAPLMGSILLAIVGYPWLFALTGIIITGFGLIATLGIRDIKRAGATLSPDSR